MTRKLRDFTVSFAPPKSKDAFLRMGLEGGPGAGKTWTSLAIAQGLVEGDAESQIAVIDSDGGAVKFRNYFDFSTYRLYDNHPDHYVSALRAAEAGGFKVAIVDSGSLAWSGVGGAKELVDVYKSGNNDFTGWKEVSPIFKRFLDTIDDVQMHVIVTLRLKTEWVMEKNDRGKMVPINVGLEADFGKEGHYKFDIIMRMNSDNNGYIWKSRFPDVQNKTFAKPGSELATELLQWLSSNPADEPFDRAGFGESLAAIGVTLEACAEFCASLGKPMPSKMTEEQRQKLLGFLSTPPGQQRIQAYMSTREAGRADPNKGGMPTLKAS
ncbi:MAG: AAA family ATPase [Bradymonadia bacterium]